MKKIYFFGAVAAAALALTTGCSKNELVSTTTEEAKAIAFRVNGDVPQQRPNGPQRTTGTTKPYVNAFAVWGEDYLVGGANGNLALFDGVTIAKQLDGSYDYNPKRLYSLNADTAYFYAYSPISPDVSNVTVTPKTSISFNYVLPAVDASKGNTTQEDLLVACKKDTVKNQVVLDFTHALSRVFVNATNSMTQTDVVVKSLKLKNLNKQGTMTYPLQGLDTIGWVSSNPDDWAYALADSGVVVKAQTASPALLTSMEQGMMIIPQAVKTTATSTSTSLTAGDFALEVVYDKANLKNQTYYVLLKDNFAFVPNKQYVITIDFSGTAITFDLNVTPFVDGAVQYP